MTPAPIPADVQRFVLLGIPSVPYLEALLLMRSSPERWWDAQEVSRRLYLSEKIGDALLAELTAAGLADPDTEHAGQYRYRPQSEQLTEVVDRLADIYAKNLVGVSNLIHSKLNKKAQQFVEAFVLRKES